MTISTEASARPSLGDGDWGEITVRISSQLANSNFSRGDLAALRRMPPGTAQDAPVFWRLAARYHFAPRLEREWALIVHGIALMTPTATQSGPARSAHNPSTPVGAALFRGGEDSPYGSGFYSEQRLNRLLTARGTVLHALLARMFRMLASSGVTFDWREMARFILLDGLDASRAEEARRRVARTYYRAEQQSGPPADP